MAELGSVVSKTVTLESQLLRLADPQFHERKEVLQSRIRWADRRLQAARADLSNCEANLRGARRSRPREIHAREILLEEARREFADACDCASEAQNEQAKLRQKMVAE